MMLCKTSRVIKFRNKGKGAKTIVLSISNKEFALKLVHGYPVGPQWRTFCDFCSNRRKTEDGPSSPVMYI